MNKLLLVSVLSLILLSSFLLPVIAKAADECDIKFIWSLLTLPATDITNTTAVLNGQEVFELYFHPGSPASSDSHKSPFVFEYGTAPGVYTEKVEALMVSSYTDIRLEDGVIRLIDIYRASITGLKPCTKYYARLKFLISKLTPVPAPTICFEYRYGEEISFTTTGCSIGTGSHQSGGISAVAPSNRPFILSNIVVQGATVAAARVSPGEKVDVTATVANRGGSNGTSKVTLYINGQEAESKGITLSSGESTQVHFSVSRDDPGTYSIYVNGVPAGSITVDLFTNNDILIYSIIALFSIGIVGVLYLVFKRRPA